MAARKSSKVGTASGVVFTSVIAPIIVTLIAAVIKKTTDPAIPVAASASIAALPPAPPPPSPLPKAVLPVSPSSEVTRFIVHGAGSTQEDARKDAVHCALRLAISAQVDADTWARRGPGLASQCADDRHVIRSWYELRSVNDGPPGMHRKELAVDIDNRALHQRLRSVIPN